MKLSEAVRQHKKTPDSNQLFISDREVEQINAKLKTLDVRPCITIMDHVEHSPIVMQ